VDNIFVGSGGAQIWIDGHPVMQSCFTYEQTLAILDLGKELDAGMFIDQIKRAWNYGSRYYVDLFMHVSDSLECKDPNAFLNPLPGKISLCQEHSILQQIRLRLNAIYPTLTMSFPFPQVLDINPSGGNKGEGLTRLANMLGIGKDEIAVVGDSENDMSMFLSAGLTIAMGNAIYDLRSKADIIAPPNSADGIVWVLREIMKANAESFTTPN
jgi:HAD superfamily hydrolase (TIGR01484 family)